MGTTDKYNAINLALRAFNENKDRFYWGDEDGLSILNSFYRGFSDKIAADAFNKIDFLLSDIVKNASNGSNLVVSDVSLQNIRHAVNATGERVIEVTVLDSERTPAFRLKWGHISNGTEGDRFRLSMLECPEHDPEYAYANEIAGTECFKKDGVYQSTFTGGVSHTNFRKFIGALDLIRPISSDKIGEYNYGESYRGSGISWNEAELINYLPVINIDGGLPGEACLEVSNAMMKTRAGNSFLRASNVITPLVEKLEEQGVRYNERVMVYNDDDSYICFVPGDNDAILHTKLSLFTEYNSFLAFNRKDVHEETVETVFIPLKRGSDVLDAVEVLSTNNEGDLLQASFGGKSCFL